MKAEFPARWAVAASIGSMGRVGSSGDNAAMESFFALLQKNVLDHRCCPTRKQLRMAIVAWIERTYHRRRRHAHPASFTSATHSGTGRGRSPREQAELLVQ
ncbi:integrase catalytic subunit [Corynebacterium terpenotabidum Y-11]|uniref:Integrase catalytic subunit n=1 Tax=Corynebacterium terpenotabidum Y-11 TaxID=1200352 RepID=S4XAA8_9CORY|nr:integrase catalytic subunit [Corynebacterium terpenotabidum Y-11]